MALSPSYELLDAELHKRNGPVLSHARRSLPGSGQLVTRLTHSAPHPDIEWNPSQDTYLQRVERLASLHESLPQTVPTGFPTTIRSPRVWRGSDMQDETKYVYQLSHDDLLEVHAAVFAFKERFGQDSSALDPDQVTTQTFPLPSLGRKLKRIAHVIHSGQGLFIIRGLSPQDYSPLERLLAYVGITSYVGSTRACQDAGGSRVIHIKDRGKAFQGAEMRQAPYSNVAQPFHTDVCDILAMYVHDLAAWGGHFQFASSGQIYNDIAARRPDVIHTLAADEWIFDKFSDPPAWDIRPLLVPFGCHGPSFFYSRRPLTGSPVAPRTPGIPVMTERQAEALDMVHFVAARHQLRVAAERGDILLVNNLAVMHGREAFSDGGAPSEQRHVVRMWLRNEELAWPKPGVVRPIFDLKYSADSPWCRHPVWHLEPPTLPERLLERKFSCS